MLKNTWLGMSARRDLYRSKLVFFMFLLSLTIFFAAGMLSYLIIRANAFRNPEQIPYVTLQVPVSFWLSTFILLAVSISLHQAVSAVHRNRMRPFFNALSVAAIAAVAFTVVQAFGLRQLLDVHFASTNGATKSYAMCFTMAFLHALHVMGGLIFLGFVMAQAARQRYDHERHWAVDNCASYWHFLDVVWIIMLATFFIAR